MAASTIFPHPPHAKAWSSPNVSRRNAVRYNPRVMPLERAAGQTVQPVLIGEADRPMHVMRDFGDLAGGFTQSEGGDAAVAQQSSMEQNKVKGSVIHPTLGSPILV
jgi:hypothetical protein